MARSRGRAIRHGGGIDWFPWLVTAFGVWLLYTGQASWFVARLEALVHEIAKGLGA